VCAYVRGWRAHSAWSFCHLLSIVFARKARRVNRKWQDPRTRAFCTGG